MRRTVQPRRGEEADVVLVTEMTHERIDVVERWRCASASVLRWNGHPSPFRDRDDLARLARSQQTDRHNARFYANKLGYFVGGDEVLPACDEPVRQGARVHGCGAHAVQDIEPWHYAMV